MNDIIKFAIKALMAGAIVWALYNHFSPLQNCLRMIESGALELEQLEGTKLAEGLVDRLERLGLADLLERIELSDWLEGWEGEGSLEGLGGAAKGAARAVCLSQTVW